MTLLSSTIYAATLPILSLAGPGELSACLAEATTSTAVIRCQDRHTETLDAQAARMLQGPRSQATFSYLWLPACPGALPTVENASSMSCQAVTSCDSSTEVRQSLWAIQLTDEDGTPARGAWQVLFTECTAPQEVGLVAQQRALTTQDVITALRRLGVPAATVEAPQYTLVNLETTFFTRPETIDRSLTIIGYTVDVQIAPSSYRWSWGDGTTTSSRTAGQPYPSKDVTHTYLRATDPNSSVALRVDVTYAARYRVDGGPWQTIPDVMTIPGPPTDLPVKQAAAVLVAD